MVRFIKGLQRKQNTGILLSKYWGAPHVVDDFYFMYMEDLDYSYRVWKSGYKLYYVSSSQIYHKVGASSGRSYSIFGLLDDEK